MEVFSQLMVVLTGALAHIGVPQEYCQLAALVTIYLTATLLVAVLVLALLRVTRKAPAGENAPLAAAEKAADEPNAAPVAAVDMPLTAAEPDLSARVETPDGLLRRMRSGLAKTNAVLVGRIDSLLGGGAIDDALLEELEEILITADLGMKTTQGLVQAVSLRAQRGELKEAATVKKLLREEISSRLKSSASPFNLDSAQPSVIMVVGVNGVGKTTTIGKLAARLVAEGKKVVIGAGDTFRAAAAEQLTIWGKRAGADVVRHGEGADPGAVAFDAAKAAVARKADVLILDTAGRLHTKVNLMEELKKIRRVLEREIPGAPHETLLVLDATTGQNALSQAKIFAAMVEVNGLVLTKLDGTAKGGIVIAIGAELGIPVRFVGIGEQVDDLRPFDPELFVAALFGEEE
ncbi:MAG: signal recognition particle-docking protein FtsY [Desulfuromonadaceae bacterium]|nr:signal recognition particle-docking protein FtsY [Desulfuromonadaceae bacterium]